MLFPFYVIYFQDWLYNEDIDDSDADPDWSPTDDQSRKRKTGLLLCLQKTKRRKILRETDSGKLIYLFSKCFHLIIKNYSCEKNVTLLQFYKHNISLGIK